MKSTAAVVVRGRRFLKASRGANLVEYIILVGVVSVLCLVAFQQFGGVVKGKIENQKGAVQSVPDQAN